MESDVKIHDTIYPPLGQCLQARPNKATGGTASLIIAKSAIGTQVGGDQYTSLKIQPATYIFANNIGYFEGVAITYLSRWKSKGGIEDLKKARHTIDLLLAELEAAPAVQASPAPSGL